MKMFTHVMAVAAMGLWFVAPAGAQVGVNVGGNTGAGANVGNAVQRAGSGVQRAAQGVGDAARNVEQGVRNIQRGVGDAAQRTREGFQNQNQNLRNNLSGQQGLNGQPGQYQAQGNAQFRAGNQQGRFGVSNSTFVQANTPQVPARAQADVQVNAQADRDARWRKSRHNGEWWYYSPEGNWMYMRDGKWNKYDEQNFQRPNGDGTYSSNYRDNSNNRDMWMQDGHSIFRLQSDNQGRQFIRMNGRQIWVGSDADASARGRQSGRNSSDQNTSGQSSTDQNRNASGRNASGRNIEAGVDGNTSGTVDQSNQGAGVELNTDTAAEVELE